jgi:hypothetical protein
MTSIQTQRCSKFTAHEVQIKTLKFPKTQFVEHVINQSEMTHKNNFKEE